MLRRMFSEDFTVSKRQLGGALVLLGAVAVLAAVVLFAVQGSRFSALVGVSIGAAGVLVGLTLLPLGDRPA